jgi:hypothetical protein
MLSPLMYAPGSDSRRSESMSVTLDPPPPATLEPATDMRPPGIIPMPIPAGMELRLYSP